LLSFSSAFAAASPGAAAEAVSDQEVLDLDQAAALLRVRPEVVRKLAEAHRIPARRVGDVWRLSRAALLEWLKEGQLAGTPRSPPAPPSDLDRAEALASELPALSARGVAEGSSTRLAPAAAGAKPQASSPAPPTVGERPATPTAEEVALRDQRVLLKRGAVTVELGASYSRSEQTLVTAFRQEQRAVGASAALRYGLLNDVQVTVRVPGVWRHTTTFEAASPREARDVYLGDVSASLLGVALREAVGWPNVIWSVDGVLPTGPGDRGVGVGLVLSKSYDPAVIFAGLGYLHGFSVAPGDSRRSLAQHNIGLSLGYTYAVNDSLALNTVFVGTYRNAASPDGLAIPPPSERYQLQLGMTWLLARALFMEPAVAMRLGGASPDLTVSLSTTYTF
jgi:excisionase family DNA binding protein